MITTIALILSGFSAAGAESVEQERFYGWADRARVPLVQACLIDHFYQVTSVETDSGTLVKARPEGKLSLAGLMPARNCFDRFQ
ncbi:hypothetical protein FJY94_04135 [Candidatus Kaiserbacteria bacterium]|nr:hypothetical protein [Candidatus Kaiserbacteria bacterium]